MAMNPGNSTSCNLDPLLPRTMNVKDERKDNTAPLVLQITPGTELDGDEEESETGDITWVILDSRMHVLISPECENV